MKTIKNVRFRYRLRGAQTVNCAVPLREHNTVLRLEDGKYKITIKTYTFDKTLNTVDQKKIFERVIEQETKLRRMCVAGVDDITEKKKVKDFVSQDTTTVW